MRTPLVEVCRLAARYESRGQLAEARLLISEYWQRRANGHPAPSESTDALAANIWAAVKEHHA